MRLAPLTTAKRALTTIERLRKAGIAKGRPPLIGPHAGRYGPLPRPKRKDAAAFKPPHYPGGFRG
jgi:hypothetical protein